VASEAEVVGYNVGTAGLFGEAVERVRVIEDENEDVIEHIGGQRCSRSVLVG
jgi:hypothetical protein